MSKSQMVLAVLVGVLVLILSWRLLPSGPSRASLVEIALSSEDPVERQKAALALIELDNAPDPMEELITKSKDPAVRAICLQGMGDSNDFGAVNALLKALEDDSPLVRSSAAGSLGRIMRRPTHFPYEGTDDERRAAVDEIRRRWETLVRLGLVEELAKATSLSYFYDQHTGEVFEAPSHMPDAFELPSGPYQGMPAAVRANVFTKGDSRDPTQRFVGWLSVYDEILKEHGAAVPAKPSADSDSTLVRRPDDANWVYASSPAGMKMQDAVFTTNSRKSSGFVRPCLPGK
jgi:hypothetical protein